MVPTSEREHFPAVCVFWGNPATDSDASRSMIPTQADQSFRGNPFNDSDRSRSIFALASEFLQSALT